jgi:signal transduction histidine kinase
MSAADTALLQDLARHAAVTVRSGQLAAELQESRSRIVTAREEERRRLRRDLHDELAPTLAGLGLVAASVDRLIPVDPEQAQQAARRLHTAIRQATGDIRRLAHDLRPPALDELGLVEALRERVAQLNEATASPRLSIEVSGRLAALPAAVEVAAYRIVHEALMNVIRHAGARSCVVRLASLDAEHVLEVEVRDDGVGVPREQQPAGIGCRSMRERAEELGGDCRIERLDAALGGTRVLARLPLGMEQPLGTEHARG